MSKAAIARALGVSWNSVDRWLQRAEEAARGWSTERLRNIELSELQFDELRIARLDDQSNAWVYTGVEVDSRLWTTSFVSTRTYWNTYRVIQDTVRRGTIERFPLVTTDGMKYYQWAVRRAFGKAVIYAQVEKKFRNGKLLEAKRFQVEGDASGLADRLERSEDSDSINTSFVERLNLTIRQSSAYLRRRTTAHARSMRRLAGHLELLRAWYNFVRPHRGLKFGPEFRTPAQVAGLAVRPIRLLEILRRRQPQVRASGATVLPFRPQDGIYEWQMAG